MKKIILGLLCLAYAQLAFAQKDSLQFDENNQYVYYQVTDMPGVTADTLYQRGWAFAKSLDSKTKPSKGKAAYALNTKGKFFIYSGASVVKKEAGAVSYTLNIEAKDQKYRYKISNFVFIPYKRDRFNNMAPVSGLDVDAEKFLSKYSPKETDNYLNQIATFCKATGTQLKRKMEKVAVLHKPEAVKKVTTDNW